MELAEYLVVLRKYWLSVVMVTLLGVLLAAGAILLMPKIYTASTSVFLTVQSGGSAGELQQGGTYAENQVKSFAQLVTKPVVLQPVIDELKLGVAPSELAKSVTAAVPTDTALVNIDVDGRDPELTRQTADAIANQLITAVGQLSPTGTNGSQAVKATMVEPATTPIEWTSPKVVLYLLLGALLGLLIAVGQAVVRSRPASATA